MSTPPRRRYLATPPPGLDGHDAADAMMRSAFRPETDTMVSHDTAQVLALLRLLVGRGRTGVCPHAATAADAAALLDGAGGPWVYDGDLRALGCPDCFAMLTAGPGWPPIDGWRPCPDDECPLCGERPADSMFATVYCHIGPLFLTTNLCVPCDRRFRAGEL